MAQDDRYSNILKDVEEALANVGKKYNVNLKALDFDVEVISRDVAELFADWEMV